MIIVITGGIASGKSEVTKILRKLGAPVVDADEIVHKILEGGERIRKRLQREFGPEIFQNGKINRALLGKIVFASKEKRLLLEKVIHPQVKRIISRKVKDLQKKGIPLVFLEVPLFFEINWPPFFSEIWVVYSSPDLQRSRLRNKGLSEDEIEKRISAQLPWEVKLKEATRIINNDGSLKELEKKVQDLYDSLIERGLA
jgi:dephospho-CoA kinase